MSVVENAYVSNVSLFAEIEEREEQVYRTDGTPMMKQKEADKDIGLDEAHKIRVKLKRYYYRIKVVIQTTNLEVTDSLTNPPQSGQSVAKKSSSAPSGSNVNLSKDWYICVEENVRLVKSELCLYRKTCTWVGYTPWEKVPKSWKMDQSTEEVKEEEHQAQGS